MSVAEGVDPMNAAYGMFLRGVRLTQEIKQSQVARALGVTTTSVTYYERGMRKIPLITFVRWCERLGLDPGQTLSTIHKAIGEWSQPKGE